MPVTKAHYVEGWFHQFLASAIGMSGKLHAQTALPPEKEPPVPI